jgi:hypothetical protein
MPEGRGSAEFGRVGQVIEDGDGGRMVIRVRDRVVGHNEDPPGRRPQARRRYMPRIFLHPNTHARTRTHEGPGPLVGPVAEDDIEWVAPYLFLGIGCLKTFELLTCPSLPGSLPLGFPTGGLALTDRTPPRLPSETSSGFDVEI